MQDLLSGFSSPDDFVQNASDAQMRKFKSLYKPMNLPSGTITRLGALTQIQKESILDRYLYLSYDGVGIKNYTLGNQCQDNCLFGSHEAWFDMYWATGSYVYADLAESFYYTGCLNGCTGG